MSGTPKLDEKREKLFKAAEDFIFNGKSVEAQRVLCDAASAYDRERQATFRPGQAPRPGAEASGFVIPWGPTKGTPIGEAAVKDLNHVLERLQETLDAPDKARFREKNAALIAAIERELETR
ncbi:MAG TPA: hypothetical protein VN903_10765 [Polyangia bacterium]|nr:hypothetical protein [Polyangia bacterium]